MIAQAEAEGLMLKRAKSQTGYLNVVWSKADPSAPFEARGKRVGFYGRGECLKRFQTAAEAALDLARRESEEKARSVVTALTHMPRAVACPEQVAKPRRPYAGLGQGWRSKVAN